MWRKALLWVYDAAYTQIARRLIFRRSAMHAHADALRLLRWLDDAPPALALLRTLNQLVFPACPLHIGGVPLPHPMILAAGFVKGDGFASEDDAYAAAATRNIIPGWRAMPALVGPVEFGSFTRWPRPGNSGVVMWRDAASRSTQNRVGLKNPGARAAARFLGCHRDQLPPVYGINLAVSPGVDDPDQQAQELRESARAFSAAGVLPAWYTLNLSCPNTDDDPGCHQTEAQARHLCAALRAEVDAPLWVKLSPDLAPAQYNRLMQVFADSGVRAVIATNTLPAPTPDERDRLAGVGGGRLRMAALTAVRHLAAAQTGADLPVDVIACGGVLDGPTCQAYLAAGAGAFQYWSALIYRGPLAAASMLMER